MAHDIFGRIVGSVRPAPAPRPSGGTLQGGSQLSGELRQGDDIFGRVNGEGMEGQMSRTTNDYNSLKNKPSINGQTLVGNLELDVTDKHFVHRQRAPSSEWTIAHSLGKHPAVSVVDSGGSVVVGSITHLDENHLKITFTVPFSGTAYLN